jgi:environmental stress-induced protein Ves
MIKQLARNSYKTMMWKNGKGTTTEIFKHPSASTSTSNSTSIAASDFEWRISSAMVAENGPFSSFPGFQRSIAVLNDSLVLQTSANITISGSPTLPKMVETIINQQSAPFSFSGDDTTSGILVEGKTVLDFNVFTDRRVCEQHVTRLVSAPVPPKPDSGNHLQEVEGSRETRCGHCFITFSTPSELVYHNTHHCFPNSPGEVMKRYPLHTPVLDTVTGRKGVILGPANNDHKIHACVSVRMEVGGGKVVEADMAISRLAVRKSLCLSSPTEFLVFCSFVGQVEVATSEDKVLVEEGDSCVVSNYVGDVHYAHSSVEPLDVFVVHIKDRRTEDLKC